MFSVFTSRSLTALLLIAATLPLTIVSTPAQAGPRAKKAAPIVVVSNANRWRAIDASGWRRPYNGLAISGNLSLGQWLNAH